MAKKFYYIGNIENSTVTGDNSAEATLTSGVTFRISNAKFYLEVVTLSANDSSKFLEHLKQGFRKTIYWKNIKTTQPKNNNLDYVNNLAFKNINSLFIFSFKNGDNQKTVFTSILGRYWKSKILMHQLTINHFLITL